jgi:hypothetical protein
MERAHGTASPGENTHLNFHTFDSPFMTDLSALLGAKLFEVARTDIETAGLLNKPKRNIIRWLTVKFIFTRPRLLRFVGRLLYCYQAPGLQTLVRKLRLAALLPKSLRELEPLIPRRDGISPMHAHS